MKRNIPIRLLSIILTLVMMYTMCTVAVSAAAEKTTGKYLKDVYIATGTSEDEAKKWLENNGWDVIGNLNKGKSDSTVAVMGIKRTSNPKEAITDIAAMDMKGGYSFDEYEDLVKKKKADITEFINTFLPALNEYRANYNGEGSEGGQKRAQMAHDILNKFYDGDPNDKYAVNDTGKPLGDLLLNKTSTELGEEAYKNLSAEEKQNTADFQQIILESSGPAVLIVKRALALATDTAEDSWLDRLNGMTDSELTDNIEKYVPEAEGRNLAPSAAMNLLASHFEDYSKRLAEQWKGVRSDILWFEQYCDENELWSDKENAELDVDKTLEYFTSMKENDESRFNEEFDRFYNVYLYYNKIKEVTYEGEWGETLFEFFRPEDEEADYSEDYDKFAPLAASLSDGQRVALEFIDLRTMLKVAMDSDSVTESDFPSASELFSDGEGNEVQSVSIYTGINRAIFRKGVALTSKALQEKSMGKDPYEKIWGNGGIVQISSIVGVGVFTITTFAGFAMYSRATRMRDIAQMHIDAGNARAAEAISDTASDLTTPGFGDADLGNDAILNNVKAELTPGSAEAKLATAGKWLAGIGAALMIASAALMIYQMVVSSQAEMTMIPMMIVDRADIVEEEKDEKTGEMVIKNIDFNQFLYYEVVRCNRQDVGVYSGAQKGVKEYEKWGCGDAADLNGDVGMQWLAMYVNRSSTKGNPILADSITLVRNEKEEDFGKTPDTPANCNAFLHMFGSKNPLKIDDIKYSGNDSDRGLFLYWKGDENALTASTFSAGNLALAGIGGLALGILGTTLVMLPKLRKKKEEEAFA